MLTEAFRCDPSLLPPPATNAHTQSERLPGITCRTECRILRKHSDHVVCAGLLYQALPDRAIQIGLSTYVDHVPCMQDSPRSRVDPDVILTVPTVFQISLWKIQAVLGD